MKNTNRMHTIYRVLLSGGFVLSLICSILCICVAGTFSPAAVERQLKADGFYAFADDCVAEELSALQGVIGVDSDDLHATVSEQELTPLLRSYTDAVSRHVLYGEQTDETVAFRSEALYALVCDAITEEHYHGNTVQLETDRRDAYNDLVTAVDNTLSFFPTKLYTSATDILAKGGVRLSTVYAVIRILRIAVWPCLLLTVLTGVGIFLCDRRRTAVNLRTAGGCAFLTGAVFCMLTVFMGRYSLLSRLSLGDGLLRRYILAMFENGETTVFLTTLTVLCIGAVLLVFGILHQVFANSTCKPQENVIE